MLDPELLEQAKHERDRVLELQHDVERARSDYHHTIRRLSAAGASLREIADSLGLSHQRVHQIVDSATGEEPRPPALFPPLLGRRGRRGKRGGSGPFHRFSGEARQVVVAAQVEARSLGHGYVGTEHLLLGLLRETGPAAEALQALGVSYDAARAAVVELIGEGDERRAGRLPFTPLSKKALELALRESLARGDRHIGPEHLLLVLAREGEMASADVLARLGTTAEAVAAELERRLAA